MIYSNFLNWLNTNWLMILIIVLSVVIGIWIIAIVFATIFYHIFEKALKDESAALNVLLKERHKTLIRYIEVAKNYNIQINPNDINGINRLERIDDFQSLSKTDRDERMFAFLKSAHNITALCDQNEDFRKDDEYDLLKNMYLDLEDAYRQKCAKYNSNVLGYNYWIHIPGTRLIFKMFKIRKKDLII